MRSGYDEHRRVVQAIAAADEGAADRAMRAHIANTISRLRAGAASSV
jgi:DNA-binding GntR family transcriptional regulator